MMSRAERLVQVLTQLHAFDRAEDLARSIAQITGATLISSKKWITVRTELALERDALRRNLGRSEREEFQRLMQEIDR